MTKIMAIVAIIVSILGNGFYPDQVEFTIKLSASDAEIQRELENEYGDAVIQTAYIRVCADELEYVDLDSTYSLQKLMDLMIDSLIEEMADYCQDEYDMSLVEAIEYTRENFEISVVDIKIMEHEEFEESDEFVLEDEGFGY